MKCSDSCISQSAVAQAQNLELKFQVLQDTRRTPSIFPAGAAPDHEIDTTSFRKFLVVGAVWQQYKHYAMEETASVAPRVAAAQ